MHHRAEDRVCVCVCVRMLMCHLLMTLLWTTFRMMILCVQSFRKSVSLFFSAALVSCLATTFRLSHDALQRLSSWTRFSDSSSKSTWRKK